MLKAVMVTLLLHHVSSTDNNSMQQFCPQGEESLCFYNKGLAAGETPKHTKEN